tara:strand:+ start:259 stop:378 length:120 start_codon:yes stop_codon:yes gene_type:complete
MHLDCTWELNAMDGYGITLIKDYLENDMVIYKYDDEKNK